MKGNIKAITPVVATALLLVVAVVAVVGFQTWFNTYQAGLNTKVETQSSNTLGNTGIQNIIGNELYFKNSKTTNITITSIKIGYNDCNVSGNFSTGMLIISLGNNCTKNLTTSTPDIVVYTKNGIYDKKVYLNNIVSSTLTSGGTPSLNCSALGLAGGTWITVPGNSNLGTSSFCVMKYEAKNVGGVPTSTAANTPWVSITQPSAQTACAALGSHYHLITNAEWTTIARNAENVSSNWNSSIVGVGYMYSGHNDGTPNNALNATTNDSNGYYGTDSVQSQRRTLYLSNGQVIWDLAGNVVEWNNDTCNGSWNNNNGWIEWTNSVLAGYDKSTAGPFGSYTSANGVGAYFGCLAIGDPFYRGGAWVDTTHAGAFALALNIGPSTSGIYYGFRCAYTP